MTPRMLQFPGRPHVRVKQDPEGSTFVGPMPITHDQDSNNNDYLKRRSTWLPIASPNSLHVRDPAGDPMATASICFGDLPESVITPRKVLTAIA